MTASGDRDKTGLSAHEGRAHIERGARIYIYGNGVAGRWLWSELDQLGMAPTAFIDTDVKKQPSGFGFPTISVANAEMELNPSDLIIIAAVDIHEILNIKWQTSLEVVPWVSLGEFAQLLLKAGVSRPTNEFDNYALNVVIECHERLLDPEDLYLRSVDVMITEKCSLRCRDCANLMQYYEAPKDVSTDGIIAALNWLLSTVDGVHELRLIGGEPFMNKKIYEIIEEICSLSGFEKLVIYTNGMVPLKESQKDLMSHPKIIFSVTDYGALAKNTHAVVEQLEEWGCTYRVHPPEHWTDSGRIMHHGRSDEANQRLFDECCGKNLWTISDQGFGRCPFSLNAAHLGVASFDGVDNVPVGSKDDLRAYTQNSRFLPVCDLCNGRSFSSPEIIPAIQVPSPIPIETSLYK